ncbi:MAG TPA: SPW repeat protein [Xanthobacteraceae bacterium]|jgi:hypothetical protein|nr:SPW repeat protein [Xanthobacteraceae bacterium]
MLLRREEAVLDLYNIALAVFLFASPWLFAFPDEGSRFNAWVGGGIIIAMSAAAILAFAEWEEWISFGLGLWLVASPWVLGFGQRPAHVIIAVGAIVAFLAALKLFLMHDKQTASHH